MTRTKTLARGLLLLAALLLVAAGCGDDGDDDADGAATETTSADTAATGFEGDLTGTFEITAGVCADGAVTEGSFFRMVQPGGGVEDGPFIDNANSICGDTTYTALEAGSDGGLVSGSYQPAGDPAFDAEGNATSGSIIAPVTFFGLDFAVASDETDAQTGDAADAPVIVATDGELSGDLAAIAAYYGGEVFNQGAPTPSGENPGLTAGPTGTIDPETGEFVLEWTSQIEGGAFNEFTGVWHLEGTFTAG